MGKKIKKTKEKVGLKGLFRVQLTEDEGGKTKVVGDSGWQENQVTNLGIQDYIVDWLIADTGNGKSVTHVALGTGSQPASNGTDLQGEVEKRTTVATSIVDSRTAQFAATFGSSDSFVTNTQNISNIGLFNTSSGGTIFAGNTYASSSCATNQNVNVTLTKTGSVKRNFSNKWCKFRETLRQFAMATLSEVQVIWKRATTIITPLTGYAEGEWIV